MDHPLPAPDALVRPWRTAAYVAGAVAVVERALLILIGGGRIAGALSDRMQVAARDRVLPTSAHTSKATTTPSAAHAKVVSRQRTKTVVMVKAGDKWLIQEERVGS